MKRVHGLLSVIPRLCFVYARRLQGLVVLALVGKSGSGKSFRARAVAEEGGDGVIIDDGLVIHHGRVVAGRWAKNERSLMGAVRRALFAEPREARAARRALRQIRPRGVLITATSGRMARLVASALWLPPPSRTIRIEEVATPREIETALRRRARSRSHAAPVAVVQVRRGVLRSILDAWRGGERGSVRVAAPRHRGKPRRLPQALVRRTVEGCVKEFDSRIEVRRVVVRPDGGMTTLEIAVLAPPGRRWRPGDLKDHVIGCLQRDAGLLVGRARLEVAERPDRPVTRLPAERP